MTAADPLVLQVQAIVARVAGPARTPADVGADTPLGAGGFWLDSIDLLEVVIACRAELGVALDFETELAPSELETVGSLTEVIRRRRPPE